MLLLVRPHISQAFVFPALSMSPTINPGDRILVNKLLRPRRMDLVVYWNDAPKPVPYCHRLIGLPGESLRFEKGGIVINDQPLDLPPFLAGRCQVNRMGKSGSYKYEEGETITLGSNEYFFLGDNAERSADSRRSGPSHASDLIGVIDLMYWPPGKFRIIR